MSRNSATVQGAAAPARPARTGGPAALRFGPFPITETTVFPPVAEPHCWVYLTLNAEIALSWHDNPVLRALVASPRARISIDSQWLWWALRRKYPHQALARLAGSDLIHDLAAHCVRTDQRLLLLGSTPQANAGAVRLLRQRWPGLAVAGFAPPAFTPGDGRADEAQARSMEAIRAYRADYVVLGLGAAKEHAFAVQAMERLDGQAIGLLCFGGAIDLASGLVSRAPPLWQKLGLEGGWRVLQQPARAGRLLRVLRILPLLWRRDY